MNERHGRAFSGHRVVMLMLVLGAVLLPAASLRAGPPCPGDVDGDGAVGFGDLLGLLVAWGPVAPCPPPPPEDLTGDCSVGFDDLLQLLASWGPCPAPAIGACCLAGGGCAETTGLECLDSGGTFLGEDTACPPGACGAGVTGACCLPSGACVEIDVPACAAQGGAYQGPGVQCGPGACP